MNTNSGNLTSYPSNLEFKIGFDVVRTNLAERCQSSMGRKEVEKMKCLTDRNSVMELLNQTSEMKGVFERGEDFPTLSYNDLHTWLPSLQTDGAYATAENFLKLRSSLQSAENAHKFFIRREGADEDSKLTFPALARMCEPIQTFPELTIGIDRVIDKTGYIKDSASPELAEIRRELSGMQSRIARATQRIFSQALKEGLVEKDTSPTIRDGRMVIPIPAANKRSIRGIIHDESSTGKTVFVEPAETVELGNRFRELLLEEQRIIVKILVALSDLTRPFIGSILDTNQILGKIDFTAVKARFAIEIGGEMPAVGKAPEIDWYGAFHPVLLMSLRAQGRKIVPLNLRLEGKKRILIISGPNAGGKSVALKTVGVVQYMFQCGMLPTLYSNSRMGIFNKIFMDIGDEQSIENDLSTYSSHLKNMRYFLLHSTNRTLALIDEIGSGTEPTIGSSLAKSILLELEKSRCYAIVTTHYHNLKKLAEENESFINGAMLYDREHLQPTFQLSIGNAGSSFALEIAGKIGLPRNVIEAAKKEVGDEYVESDKFLMEIARDRKYWQTKRASIKERENRLQQLEQKYEHLISELSSKRKEIIKGAQEEAKSLLSSANKRIENTISEIRQVEAEKEKTKKIRKELELFKEEVEKTDDSLKIPNSIKKLPKIKKERKNRELPKTAVPTPVFPPKKSLEEGDYVKMSGSNTVGRIISISGKDAEVAFGSLRTIVKLSRLQAAAKPKENLTSNYSVLNASSSIESRRRQLDFSGELDIRGMRADEALDRLTHFIDDALQFGIGKVRILHGTGAGILRQLVRQQLGATPGVNKYEDEDVRLGGAGITVATLS